MSDKHSLPSCDAPSDSPADAGQATSQANTPSLLKCTLVAPRYPSKDLLGGAYHGTALLTISSNRTETTDDPLRSCQQTSDVISMAQGSRLGWSGPGHLSRCLGGDHWQSHWLGQPGGQWP